MTEIQDVFNIQANVKKSWALISALSAVNSYLPGIKAVSFEGRKRKGIGALRIIEYHSGTILKERVVTWQDQQSIRFEIEFLRGNQPPLDSLSHEWRLAADEGASILSSTIRYTPKYDVIGRLIDAFYLRRNIERAYRNSCLAFKYFLEAGQLVTPLQLRKMQAAHSG